MTTEPALLAIRFGTGRSPRVPDPARTEDLLAPLAEPDRMLAAFPGPDLASADAAAVRIGEMTRALRARPDPELEAELQALKEHQTARLWDAIRAVVARGLDTGAPLRERLAWFWSDHFTVVGKGAAVARLAVAAFGDEAIRPYLSGRFADMLKAVVKHPAMLRYLDQTASIGPNSPAAQRNPGRGLNENLARELLELHTLGVGGSYGQRDVRELAELLAGLLGSVRTGFVFRRYRGEPGPETVLGRAYGGETPALEDIDRVLEDLAIHPDTGRHIARKLAVHFVSDQPDPALVDAVAQRFVDTEGDLPEVTAALVEHPLAQLPDRVKVRQPFDYVVAGLRALGVTGQDVLEMPEKAFRQRIERPLARMGQSWQQPSGPDGWPEAADHWATPQGLASRIDWAIRVTGIDGFAAPDPRSLVRDALGPLASPRLVWAAGQAETRRDGVAIVLASPDFQRR